MKKITLLFTLLISFWGFSQNLVTNGDFQTGTAAPWTGNAANVVNLGAGNFANEANVTVAGNAYDVNLSQVVDLVDGKTYKLKFDAFTATTTGTRTLIAGLGQTGAPYASLTSTLTLTSTSQTFSYDFTINYGNTVTDRVIFDMGAATGFVFIDNVSVIEVLPLIQNFQTPANYTSVGSFGGATAAITTDPAAGAANGSVLKGSSVAGGEVWQGIEFYQTVKKAKLTTNKTMTVDVYCSQAFNLLGRVEIGGPTSANAQAYTTPGQWQTLTFNFAVPMDGQLVANGEYEKIVFYANWNATNTGFNTATSFDFYIDNLRAEEAAFVIITPVGPTVAAPTPPARPVGEFLSLFSNAYTNIAIAEWGTSWDSATISDLVSVPGDDIKKINFVDFLAVQFANYENATSMTHFHMDYWIPAGTDLTGKVINPKFSNHAAQAGETNALLLTHLPTTSGSWVSIDAALSTLSPQGPGVAFARQNLLQFLIASNIGTVYVDNIYLHKNTTSLSTDSFAISKVKLYPNPTSNVLNIESVGTIQNIAIFNVLGQEVMNKLTNQTLVSLDVSGLNAGVYVIKTAIDGTVSSTKFIKE